MSEANANYSSGESTYLLLRWDDAIVEFLIAWVNESELLPLLHLP